MWNQKKPKSENDEKKKHQKPKNKLKARTNFPHEMGSR